MKKPTAVLLCPGRGSYTKDELGFVGRTVRPGPVAAALDACDDWRRSQGRQPLREIDGAEKFRPGLHLDGENAAELIYFGTMAHAEALRERYEIVAVAGNSLGWYTALPASGALDPTNGWRLVATMAALQKQVAGGQVLMTNVDDDWRLNVELRVATHAVVQALRDRGDETFCDFSIHLGGHEVLAGTEAAVTALLTHLPKVKVGEREFPFRLAGHGPFHTQLCASTSQQAAAMLADLPVQMPRCHLIDGFGNVHSPWSARSARAVALHDARAGAGDVRLHGVRAHGDARVPAGRAAVRGAGCVAARAGRAHGAGGRLARPARQAGTVRFGPNRHRLRRRRGGHRRRPGWPSSSQAKPQSGQAPVMARPQLWPGPSYG